MKYDEIRGSLKTGDMVLFSGKGFISNIIKLATGSKWSHVGMVLEISDYSFMALWESTKISDMPDLIDGEIKKGVQIQQLSTRIKYYDGEVGIRRLSAHVTNKMEAELGKLIDKLRGRPYEESELELLKSVYDLPGGKNEGDLSSVFCSESFAEGYKVMGLLPDSTISNELTPKDLSKMETLLSGYSLKPVEIIS